MLVCDKRDRPITCVFVLMFNQYNCVLIFYKKEGEVWRKLFSNRIVFTLVTQGLPSSSLCRDSLCVSSQMYMEGHTKNDADL